MVYVLNPFGQPLMPTDDHRKVRILLKEKKATVVRRSPFTSDYCIGQNSMYSR